jgi:hypothetical protein
MSKPSTGSLFAVTLEIPACWTPEQALAIVELLDDLRDKIWAHYAVELLDTYREQYGSDESPHADHVGGDDPPF